MILVDPLHCPTSHRLTHQLSPVARLQQMIVELVCMAHEATISFLQELRSQHRIRRHDQDRQRGERAIQTGRVGFDDGDGAHQKSLPDPKGIKGEPRRTQHELRRENLLSPVGRPRNCLGRVLVPDRVVEGPDHHLVQGCPVLPAGVIDHQEAGLVGKEWERTDVFIRLHRLHSQGNRNDL
jgi:hypothetical protein